MGRTCTLKIASPGFEACLDFLLASYTISLSLGSLLCKMGLIIGPTPQDLGEDPDRYESSWLRVWPIINTQGNELPKGERIYCNMALVSFVLV